MRTLALYIIGVVVIVAFMLGATWLQRRLFPTEPVACDCRCGGA